MTGSRHKHIAALAVLTFLVLVNIHSIAQESGKLKGFYGSFNLGPGIVNENIRNDIENTSLCLAMHFNLGFFITRKIQTGFTMNGWLFEAFGLIPDGFKGESISNGMVHVQYYPLKSNRFFLKGAYGFSDYTNLRPEKYSGSGSASMIAAGYERQIGKREFLAGIQVSFNSGKIKINSFPGTYESDHRNFQSFDLTLFLSYDK